TKVDLLVVGTVDVAVEVGVTVVGVLHNHIAAGGGPTIEGGTTGQIPEGGEMSGVPGGGAGLDTRCSVPVSGTRVETSLQFSRGGGDGSGLEDQIVVRDVQGAIWRIVEGHCGGDQDAASGMGRGGGEGDGRSRADRQRIQSANQN